MQHIWRILNKKYTYAIEIDEKGTLSFFSQKKWQERKLISCGGLSWGMLTSSLNSESSEYLAQFFKIIIQVCCNTKSL